MLSGEYIEPNFLLGQTGEIATTPDGRALYHIPGIRGCVAAHSHEEARAMLGVSDWKQVKVVWKSVSVVAQVGA